MRTQLKKERAVDLEARLKEVYLNGADTEKDRDSKCNVNVGFADVVQFYVLIKEVETYNLEQVRSRRIEIQGEYTY